MKTSGQARRPAPQAGIAIVLVVGIMGMISLLAYLSARIGELALIASRAATRQTGAALAAGSGLEYGGARLWQDPIPVPQDLRTAANAGDDWMFRDPAATLLGRAASPSYARSGGTGRLRGDADGALSRFSLRILSEEGKACVNSGELGSPVADHDMDGVLNGSDPDYAAEIPAGAHRDPAFWGNVHLVNLLNNLGAVLGLSDVHDEPFETPIFGSTGAMGTIRVSNLGRIVVANRPQEGYVSIDQLKPFLLPADFERAAPFLSTKGEIIPITIPPAPPNGSLILTESPHDTAVSRCDQRIEFHARIDFNTAPVEILAASLRHIAAGATGDTLFIRLIEGEADAIAARLAEHRSIHTWKEMLQTLRTRCLALHADDPFTKQWDSSPLDDSVDPVRQRLKEDLILAQASAGEYFPDPLRWRHNSLEVPREDEPVALEPSVIRHVFKHQMTADVLITSPFEMDGTLPEDLEVPFPANFRSRRTVEWSLASLPSAFRVESLGLAGHPLAAVGIAGTFHPIHGAFTVKSQDALERRGASGLAPLRLPGGVVDAVTPAVKTGAATFPRFPLDSSATGLSNYQPAAVPPGSAFEIGQFRYPPGAGGITLGVPQHPWAQDLEKTTFALPFNEDFPDDADTVYDPVRWEDNCLDPVDPARRAAPPDSSVWHSYYNWHLLIVPPPGQHPDFNSGCRMSPWGPRTGSARFTWMNSFPMPRGDYNAGALPGAGEIREGTIECWYPNLGGDFPLFVSSAFRPPTVAFYLSGRAYCQIFVHRDGSFSLDDNDTATPASTYFPTSPLPWHHLALRFDAAACPPGSDQTLVHVYIDGVERPAPCTLSISSSAPPINTEISVLTTFPLDDIAFHPAAEATDPLILARAQQNRFSTTGTYTTPRFRFDASVLPEGARIRGLSWDGFIPSQTGGRFTLTVRGFAPDGVTPTGSDQVSWDGAGIQAGPLAVPLSHEFVVDVRIDTDPAAWPQVAGIPTLRDAPVLEELRILYATRPYWTDLSRN